MEIRELGETDAAAFRALRLRALGECPAAFASSYEEECQLSPEQWQQRVMPSARRATFGAFADQQLVGITVVRREQRRKLEHRANILSVYVSPECRARGIARELLEWRERTAAGQDPKLVIVGRKGRDYMNRRDAPILEYLPGVWDKLGLETAQRVGKAILTPFNEARVDAIYLVYNEFKSAMSQQVTVERLLPVRPAEPSNADAAGADAPVEFIFEPDKAALLERLVPMYVDVSILRALYESQASELGARMTAMDAATKNASEMINALTLQYNKARQAAITKELMEIIGGSEALKE